MKKMFLPLFLSFVIAVSLTACDKEKNLDDNGNSSYYIKCKIDGTDRTFNYNNMAVITDYGVGTGVKGLSLVGNASATTMEGLNLSINFNSGAPAAGTYSEDDTNNDYVLGGVYNPGSTTIVYGAGTTYQSVLPLSVTITQIDTKEISGTFKGAFYKTDLSTGNFSSTEYVTFTEGEFKLPIKQ